jgi:pilus assembly protein CpaB
MIKRRGLFLVLISLTLAISAAWVARSWIQARLGANTTPNDPGMTVVVATMEIPYGTRVEARHLRTITLPRDAQVGNHYDKIEDVVGLIAVQKIISGEILLRERFADRSSGSTLAAVLKPNMRAVTVRVDDVVGVAGFLLPGNHVDVVAARMNNQRAETETVLRNLNVLAVDQSASPEKDQPVVVRAVTLEVTPKQAEALVKAREEGRIQLTLRNPLEDSAPDMVAETAPPPPPAPKVIVKRVRVEAPRAPSAAITIIRGTNVRTAAAEPST